jgi:hypothetical protein
MTQKNLEKVCKEWQRKLRLQDWKVRIRFGLASEMTSEGRIGETRISFNNKSATIIILPEEQWGEDVWASMASVVRHELLHLHFEPAVKDEKAVDRWMVEAAIECIAEAFEA